VGFEIRASANKGTKTPPAETQRGFIFKRKSMKESAYKLLETLEIVYKKFEHPPMFTCEDAKLHRVDCEFIDIKNLFVRNKDKSNLYLFTLPADVRADLKQLQARLGETRLCFADADMLMEKLKVSPGSVSLLNIANLDKPDITVLIDKKIMDSEYIGCHPNINTETVVFHCEYIPKILNHVKVKWQIIGGANEKD